MEDQVGVHKNVQKDDTSSLEKKKKQISDLISQIGSKPTLLVPKDHELAKSIRKISVFTN